LALFSQSEILKIKSHENIENPPVGPGQSFSVRVYGYDCSAIEKKVARFDD
jgi:hypothetical protein